MRVRAQAETGAGLALGLLGQDDVPEVVRIHQAAFPSHFLTSLGRRFLEAYYRALSRSPLGLGVVARSADEVVGFVAGFQEPGAFYRELRRRWWPGFLAACWPQILGRPRMLVRLAGRARLPRACPTAPGTVVLSSLAVRPSGQGGGLGRRLVVEFLDLSRARGGRLVTLGTRGSDAGAAEFYTRLGFRLARQAPAGGDVVYEFHYYLDGEPGAGAGARRQAGV